MTSLVNKVLAAALVVQGALVAVTWTMSRSEPVEAHTLVDIDPDTVTALTITGRTTPDGEPPEPVRLERGDSGWTIESTFGYPATDDNVARALEPLTDLEVRAPIATQAYNHESLDVADSAFTRRVEVTTPDGDHTLYLGAAEGKGLNVRLAGHDDVYSVRGASAWAIPDNANRFFDRDVFEVPAGEIGSLTIRHPDEPPIELVRATDGTWTSPALPEGASLDDAATEVFVGKVARLRMLEPAAASPQPEHGLDDGIEVTWTDREGVSDEASRYRVGAEIPDVKEQRFVHWDGQPFVLRVRQGTLIELLETRLDDLTGEAPAAPPP